MNLTTLDWLVVFRFNATVNNSYGHIMAVGDAHVFPGFLTPVVTQLSFPKPPTTFLTCSWRGENTLEAGKKVCLNWESSSQPPGHESDSLTTEPPGRDVNLRTLPPQRRLN